MVIERKTLDELIPYENNPRNNDDAVDGVKRSIQQYGFIIPILIDANNVIICGHTRYKAARDLKLKDVPCLRADGMTEEQVKAFRIIDNKASEYATWDTDKLFEELRDIPKGLFTGMSFDEMKAIGEDLVKQLKEEAENAEPKEKAAPKYAIQFILFDSKTADDFIEELQENIDCEVRANWV